MRRPVLVAAALAIVLGSSFATAQTPAAASYAVRCGRLLTGDGTTELRDAWLVVKDGKIASVGTTPPPADLPVVDARGRVVMPGIVAVDTDLGTPRDGNYTVAPDVMAVDGFDFEATQRDALQGGVTTAYVSPGRDRLISGQGAVVKTAGKDLVQRVLQDGQSLRVNFDPSGVRAPRVFEPTPHPTDADPLEPARVQGPTARLSVLAELRELFASAPKDQGLQGEGSSENHYDPAPLRAVLAHKLPLRAAAWQAADIRRALLLQAELAAPMVLENPQEIAPLASQCKEQGVAAVFRLPFQLGRGNPGGEDRSQEVQDGSLDAPAQAAAAGMTVGLAPGPGQPLRDYLLAVALAVRGGLSPQQALRGVGMDASQILGVADRVGRLQPGLDADFVVLSGDPLAIGTMVESTWIDGRCEFERKTKEELLAVRVGRILDGTGKVLRNGVLIAQGGRIKAVGEDLAIPYGARVVELPAAVMTPGFVDAFSHLGLSGQGTGIPQGQPGQQLEHAVQHDDPLFSKALEFGVTSVLVAGEDGGLLSGRVGAFKTGALDRQGSVLRAICGQRVVFDAIGPDSQRPLAETLDRGKKYTESWAAYEKAHAEWKVGKKAAPPPTPAPTPEAAATPDPVSGTWEANLDIQGRFQLKVLLDLKLEDKKVTGQIRLAFGQRDLPPQEVQNGKFEDGRLHLEFRSMGQEATIDGTVKDDAFEGTVALGPMGNQPLSAKRIAKEPGAKATPTASASGGGDADTGEPKPPETDQGLEPLRAVFEHRAALVVRVGRAAAIRAVLAVVQPLKIAYALQDPDGVLDDRTLLGSERPPILLEPDVVREEKGQPMNVAAAYADLGLPIVFGSSDCLGARLLPLHAAYAVRYGLSPDDALAAITSHAAQAFLLDDRIGSLQKGRDADFVVFSGDPFDPQSRVLLVACNGRIAVDHREVPK